MGKKCCVPHCYTGYKKYKEKHPMYGVPKDDFFMSKWQDAIARADRPLNTNDCVCQKHFQSDDFIRSRVIKGELEEYKVPKLKPDAIPSIFPETPECIHGTVKKRRKLSVDTELYKKTQNCDNKNETKCNEISESEKNDAMVIDNNRIKKEPKDIYTNTPQDEEKCDKKSSQDDTSTSAIQLFDNVVLKEEIQIKEEEFEDFSDEVKQEPLLDIANEVNLEKSATNLKIYRCTQCEYSTKWSHNLQTHQTKHLEGEEHYYKCEECPKFRTKWITTYKNHMKTKHSPGPIEIFKCKLCPFETKVKICLKRHTGSHMAINTKFQCPQCSSYFSTQMNLDKHQKLGHFDLDANDVDNNNKTILNKNGDESIFNCAKCSYHTNSHKELLKHLVTSRCYVYKEDKNTKFQCKDCEFKCNIKGDFLKHTLMHRNISVQTLKKNIK